MYQIKETDSRQKFTLFSFQFFFLRVPPFKASKYLVTNREYLAFVNEGGYENSKYWTKEGT